MKHVVLSDGYIQKVLPQNGTRLIYKMYTVSGIRLDSNAVGLAYRHIN
jgi:hypothetical protein